MRLGTGILITIIFVCLLCFLALIGVLFINGTSSIVIHLEFADRINNKWAFLFESISGWATEHHITNHVFTILFSSSAIYWLKYLKFKYLIVAVTIFVYLYCLGFTIMYAMCGEIIELSSRKIIGEIIKNNKVLYNKFYGYTSETVEDVILSDAVQSFLAGTQALLILIFIFKNISGLIFTKKWYIKLFRIVLILIFTPTGFITTLKKNFGGTVYNIGFYAQMFLKLAIIYALFLEDYIHVTSIKRSHVNSKNVIDIYIYITIYLILQWVGTWNLTTWGLISSNTITIILFFIFLILKKGFNIIK